MYEEHAAAKLRDDNATEVLQRSPTELAEQLHSYSESAPDKGYCYWTSPIADVAPSLLQEVKGYQMLHPQSQELLDPRGPSLWMGSSRSATQAHYDVADNVIVQMFGNKRIRLYPPSAAEALKVFPDAHPRARKSQLNFDTYDQQDLSIRDNANNNKSASSVALPDPFLDVELNPGDAISIPAFWFHHVENGMIANGTGIAQPTVSLNMFALSRPMTIAQRIFQEASRTLSGVEPITALKALSKPLFEALDMDSRKFIRKTLLDTRYAPLGHNSNNTVRVISDSRREAVPSTNLLLSAEEQERVTNCVGRILPLFHSLRGQDGVQELVVAHLLELWAVEMVGANEVADAWEAVLRTED